MPQNIPELSGASRNQPKIVPKVLAAILKDFPWKWAYRVGESDIFQKSERLAYTKALSKKIYTVKTMVLKRQLCSLSRDTLVFSSKSPKTQGTLRPTVKHKVLLAQQSKTQGTLQKKIRKNPFLDGMAKPAP